MKTEELMKHCKHNVNHWIQCFTKSYTQNLSKLSGLKDLHEF